MSEPRPQEWRPPEGAENRADDRKVFDTVAGPNMRLSDNLIQLGAVAAGTAAGAGAGAVYARQSGGDGATGAVAGGFGGLVLSLLLSGFVIGLVRAVLAMKR
ncbi:MAG: hypothetical protein LC745_06030 [Planctomycetia bacterium]|nr:hypothetical protein [Planctomycetia bacterium]